MNSFNFQYQKLEMKGFIEKMFEQQKNLKTLSNRERKMSYLFIVKENDYSNLLVLDGFSEKEAEAAFNFCSGSEKILSKRIPFFLYGL